MKNVSAELKVGLFAIIVIMILTYMTFKVGKLPLLWEKGYALYVTFDDISGLDEKSRIKIAGVEAGIVDKITLKDGRARLTLLVNPDIKVYSNAIASLRMAGLLGDRYIALTPGSSDKPLLASGDSITNVIPAAGIDVLANKLASTATSLGELADSIRGVFGEEEKTAVKEVIHNLKTVTRNLQEISEDNKVPIHNLIVRLEKISEKLADKIPTLLDDMSIAARDIRQEAPGLIENLNDVAGTLKEMVVENRASLKQSMDNIQDMSESVSSITKKIDRGEGTIGRLMKDDRLYDSLSKVSEEAGKSFEVVNRMRTFMDFHSEYNTGEAEWKGYFDLTIKPKHDKYYILGIVTDPHGSVEITDTTINGVTTTREEEERNAIEFSAQFAQRYQDFILRVGLLENTFGIGADYFFQDERGKIKFDMWDFSANEPAADSAHLKIGADYNIFKYIFVSGGVDNILNSNRRGIYLGGGLKFEDDDLKYLLGSVPSISLK